MPHDALAAGAAGWPSSAAQLASAEPAYLRCWSCGMNRVYAPSACGHGIYGQMLEHRKDFRARQRTGCHVMCDLDAVPAPPAFASFTSVALSHHVVLSFPAPKSLITILSYRERSDGVIPRKK